MSRRPSAVPARDHDLVEIEGGMAPRYPDGDESKTSRGRRRRSRLFPLLVLLGFGGLLALGFLGSTSQCVIFVVAVCVYGTLYSYWLSNYVMAKDTGTPQMRSISGPIREGAEGFLRVQYSAIFRMALLIAVVILLSYFLRPSSSSSSQMQGVQTLGNTYLGTICAISFLVGAFCSAIAGYLSMWVASATNIRVCSCATRSYPEALVVCFRGGAFSAVLDITLCVFGVASLYLTLWTLHTGPLAASLGFSGASALGCTDIPILMVGYGFGASFVALFMQLGGGIYTKAADVGADLVGKVERSIPEDDPRNPAVIADLVGDMVGDCVGSSADVFESVGAEIIGAMILGGTVAAETGLSDAESLPFVFFPLVVHAVDILVSSFGILYISQRSVQKSEAPMDSLMRGYQISFVLSVIGFGVACRLMFYLESFPSAWMHFYGCGVVGAINAYIFMNCTQYFTDYAYGPVKSIARASETGHGTNIITGVAVGMKSTAIPALSVSVAVIAAYHLGRTSGLGAEDGHAAGLFGTAVATMGMLCTACYVLSMNNFGPIADNAGGIAEMSEQPDHVREATDQLDAAGNVTKAITKGYSIGSASLACFLLFGAFMDEFSEYSGAAFRVVDIAVPEVLIGGLIGTMMVFYFTGLAVAAVGKTAEEVVHEVRRQFDTNPGIMQGKARPDYRSCVSLVTQAALTEMRYPGLLCVAMPTLTGLVFRFVGESTGRPLLGVQALAGYLMFGTVSGIMMALFLDNVGGAWDNAKKYIELGNHGGKNSEAHKAAVTGDTVGDPFKDTAGPSLHVVIKLLSTTILVLGPLFIRSNLNQP